jgi:hypothetical protein
VLLIWGFRSYIRQLAIVTLVCSRCGNPAAHRVVQRVRKFTLFFIPLFPVSKTRTVTCTFCGATTKITPEQADQYVTMSGQSQAPAIESIPAGQQPTPPPAQTPQPPVPPAQFPPAQNPQAQYPQAQFPQNPPQFPAP